MDKGGRRLDRQVAGLSRAASLKPALECPAIKKALTALLGALLWLAAAMAQAGPDPTGLPALPASDAAAEAVAPGEAPDEAGEGALRSARTLRPPLSLARLPWPRLAHPGCNAPADPRARSPPFAVG